MQGLICAGTVRYSELALILEAVRRTGSCLTMAVHCAAYAVDFVKMSKNTKLLRTRCVSQAQNAPTLVFGRGCAPANPAGGAYNTPSDLLVGWRGDTPPILAPRCLPRFD